MKISTKGRYGLTIMIELAKHHGEDRYHFVKLRLKKIYLKHTWSSLFRRYAMQV